jgi:hypothetical protein
MGTDPQLLFVLITNWYQNTISLLTEVSPDFACLKNIFFSSASSFPPPAKKGFGSCRVLWRVVQLTTTSPPFETLALAPLSRHMTAVTAVLEPALWTATVDGKTGEMRELLAEGARVDEKGGALGAAPLHAAALVGDEEAALLLLEHRADVSAKDAQGGEPLLFASLLGHEPVVLLLLEHGAEVSVDDNFGKTPLHAASYQGHEAVVKLLIGKGAGVSVTASDGQTPLHYAAEQGHANVVRVLIDNGADLLSVTNLGETAYDIANGTHKEVAAMLKAETVRRAQCEAFAMGQQERLGAGSWVRWLDAGLVRMVLEQV